MINLALTTDKLDLVTGQAATVDVHVSFVDYSSGTVTPGKQNTAITTATTTDILSVPGASTYRNAKNINIRNKDATNSVDVTVRFNDNGTAYELIKVTLATGDCLEYVEGVGWFQIQSTAKLDAKLRVASDVTNSTTSFADVTGLTCAVKNGKHYNFEARLFYLTAATTTGAQFGVNGPTMTAMRVSGIFTVTGSATAAALSAPVADITAVDTAVSVQTTGPANVVQCVMSGWINPSADGTFAVRCKSEVAASALTVKQGSWCRIWEADN